MHPIDPVLEYKNIRRTFGPVPAVSDVTLSVGRGEFFSLVGPSGCGKTTLLRLTAGLDRPDSGKIFIDGQDATEIPAHLRPVNTVFQSYALFPHLNVVGNISFGLKMRKMGRKEISDKVAEMVSLLNLGGLENRKPDELSGGQKQRVALARALVNQPTILLLDEPLAALDMKLRKELQLELKRLQRQVGMTFVYVTHDQEEALSLSDRLVIMRGGRIIQLGTPHELYEQPEDAFCARFLGDCNLLEGKPLLLSSSELGYETDFGFISGVKRPSWEGEGVVGIRPEHVQLVQESGSGPNIFAGPIQEIFYGGTTTSLTVLLGSALLKITVLNPDIPLKVGSVVKVGLPENRLLYLRK